MDVQPEKRIEIAKAWAVREITAATAIRFGPFDSFYHLTMFAMAHGIRRMAGPLIREEEVARDRLFSSLKG